MTSARALYRPGHDARHAAAVGRALIAAGPRDPTLLSQLPSPALQRKAEAMLRRQIGAAPTPAPAEPSGNVEALNEEPSGDSSVQGEAEVVLLQRLSASIGVPLAPARLHLPDDTYVDCDGVSVNPPVLAEAWAHQGQPKGGQRNKVLADALKLVHVSAALGGGHRKILCFSDDAAARPFQSRRSWYAGALRTLDVQIHVVDLPAEWRQRIVQAQQRQYRRRTKEVSEPGYASGRDVAWDALPLSERALRRGLAGLPQCAVKRSDAYYLRWSGHGAVDGASLTSWERWSSLELEVSRAVSRVRKAEHQDASRPAEALDGRRRLWRT